MAEVPASQLLLIEGIVFAFCENLPGAECPASPLPHLHPKVTFPGLTLSKEHPHCRQPQMPLPLLSWGRETTALVTPDNHLWSLTVWPLPPSHSEYLLDIISPCRLGGWVGGREGGRGKQNAEPAFSWEKLRPEGSNTSIHLPCFLT